MAQELEFMSLGRDSNGTIRRAGQPHETWPALRLSTPSGRVRSVPLTQKQLLRLVRAACELIEVAGDE